MVLHHFGTATKVAPMIAQAFDEVSLKAMKHPGSHSLRKSEGSMVPGCIIAAAGIHRESSSSFCYYFPVHCLLTPAGASSDENDDSFPVRSEMYSASESQLCWSTILSFWCQESTRLHKSMQRPRPTPDCVPVYKTRSGTFSSLDDSRIRTMNMHPTTGYF